MQKTLLTCALVAGLVGSTYADSFTFQTASGATENGGKPVDAQVIFTTSANSLHIVLENLLANPKTVAQKRAYNRSHVPQSAVHAVRANL